MKSNVVFAVMTALLFVCLAPLNAQTDMIWDAYGLGFTLEKGMKITENDGETFTAERNDLFLTIVPIKDREITEDDLSDAVVTMAGEMDYDSLTDADELELNDLFGYYVEGTKDGAHAVVIALMDVESANNYLAVIVFTPEVRNKAIQLARSFYAYDE
ncbi:MAG: hypothetical protein KA479_03660 [Saprospiraceae bacterium]|jgi:hypothetical protein|nr:hypothetical protein [Saprospiraceae bacterium]